MFVERIQFSSDSTIFIFLGAGKLVINGIANLSIGYFSMTSERNMFMKPSYNYYTSNLVWIVRITDSLLIQTFLINLHHF
jgi:hypothetical protein